MPAPTSSVSTRVDADMVQEIIDTAVPVATINACINAAYYIVQQHLLSAGISSGLLTEIERWLAAHFVAIRDPRASEEDIAGEYRVKFDKGKLGEGLAATFYGQQALAMDYTSTLSKVGLKQATLTVITEFSDHFENIKLNPDD